MASHDQQGPRARGPCRGHRRGQCDCSRDWSVLFEGRGRGLELRNVGNHWKVGQVGKQILPMSLQEETALPTPELWLGEADFRLLASRTVREDICMVVRL